MTTGAQNQRVQDGWVRVIEFLRVVKDGLRECCGEYIRYERVDEQERQAEFIIESESGIYIVGDEWRLRIGVSGRGAVEVPLSRYFGWVRLTVYANYANAVIRHVDAIEKFNVKLCCVEKVSIFFNAYSTNELAIKVFLLRPAKPSWL